MQIELKNLFDARSYKLLKLYSDKSLLFTFAKFLIIINFVA